MQRINKITVNGNMNDDDLFDEDIEFKIQVTQAWDEIIESLNRI